MKKVMLGDTLEGLDLALVNTVLIFNGHKPVNVCTVDEMMQSLIPIEVGKFSRIINTISDILAAVRKQREADYE